MQNIPLIQGQAYQYIFLLKVIRGRVKSAAEPSESRALFKAKIICNYDVGKIICRINAPSLTNLPTRCLAMLSTNGAN